MSTTSTARDNALSVIAFLFFLVPAAQAQVEDSHEGSVTVLGPSNPELAEGARKLQSGEADEGIRLTLEGLRRAASRRERLVGLSNLCAGYLLTGNLDEALQYCSRTLEEHETYWRAYSNRALVYIKLGRLEEAELDLLMAEDLAPNSRKVKIVRSMYRDIVDPVAPSVIIDDRRNPPQE